MFKVKTMMQQIKLTPCPVAGKSVHVSDDLSACSSSFVRHDAVTCVIVITLYNAHAVPLI